MNTSDSSTRAEYLSHIEKQKTSGLSIKKYCELNNLVDHKFSYYRKYKLKSTKSSEPAFASVKIKAYEKPASIKTNIDKAKTSQIDPLWLAQFLNNLFGEK
ncbi:MAG: hypothetical protein MK008_13445 [Bdellovibrionales bacterium]|nr:hypothetical protein [Bdellovibrionales bacterium]